MKDSWIKIVGAGAREIRMGILSEGAVVSFFFFGPIIMLVEIRYDHERGRSSVAVTQG